MVVRSASNYRPKKSVFHTVSRLALKREKEEEEGEEWKKKEHAPVSSNKCEVSENKGCSVSGSNLSSCVPKCWLLPLNFAVG